MSINDDSDSATPAVMPVGKTEEEKREIDAYFPMFYAELKRLARSRLAAGGRHTYLDTSVLVHESFLRIRNASGQDIKSKDHFLAYAATTMRSVIVDFVRRRSAEQRGGDVEHITLNTEAGEMLGASDDEIINVHNALEKLGEIDPRMVQIVEMRYFAGLKDEEIARALGLSLRTVGRDWEKARLLLAEMLGR